MLLIEDIHWIDGASEELLRRLIESGTQSNLLIILTRRHEYTPAWRTSPVVKSIVLNPLGTDDIKHLVRTRLGVDVLPDALIRQVTDRAAGNPLFGEEILSFLFEHGALHVASGKVDFDAALGESGLPVSMQSLFTARIDRLQPDDRELLQAAAAIGRRFDPGLLSLVCETPDETGAALRRLQAQDIVYRETNSSDYVFKHVLLRDTVYQNLVSERRAELHLSIAEAMELRNKGRLAEVAETLAYHGALTKRADLAFKYSALAGAKSLGVFSLDEANRYFAAALAIYQHHPDCADPGEFGSFLADYALCSNISLQVKTMMDLAAKVRPILDRFGDSRHHVLFLHHYVSCLVCNARYLDALKRPARIVGNGACDWATSPSMAYALVSELSMSTYCAPMSSEVFQSKRREAELALATVDDAYLQNFYLATLAWNEVSSGRVAEAREAAARMIDIGVSMNDPRSLGYGIAMKALIAMVSDDHEVALEMSEQALSVSRAEFERAIATAARISTLVPLNKPGAVEEVERFVAMCGDRGWTLFLSGPDTMLGVALALNGRIGDGSGTSKWLSLAARRRAIRWRPTGIDCSCAKSISEYFLARGERRSGCFFGIFVH